jgi:hypothetical protein
MADRVLVLMAVAAVALATGTARAEDTRLIGRRVAIDIGDVVDLPSGTTEVRPQEAHDVISAGVQYTEVSVQGRDTHLLVPAPKSHVEGNVEAADGDVLTVRLLGRAQAVTVPRAAITSIETRQRHSRSGRGALIGAGVGLAFGLGTVVYSESVDYCGGDGRGLCTAYDVVGTVITTAGGAMTHTERQERVDRRKLSVAVMPDPRGGVRGRLAVRF